MRAAVLALTMVLFGCVSPPGEALAAGRDPDLLYRAKCAACHRVYPPRNYTYQKYLDYVAKYGKGMSHEERRELLEYLKENAKQEDK